MGLFSRIKPEKKEYTERFDFSVRGIEHYMSGFQSLAYDNPLWNCSPEYILKIGHVSKDIFKHYFLSHPISLIPEPTNKYDKNAIKVMIAGKLVGYVPAENCSFVKGIIKTKNYGISCFIGGGEYKTILNDGSVITGESCFTIRVSVYY